MTADKGLQPHHSNSVKSMKTYQTRNIRNVTLLGSTGSGKTLLTEAMMFEGKVIERKGSLAAKNTVSDYSEIEQLNQKSIYATPLYTEFMDSKLNIIDTPGIRHFALWGIKPDEVIFYFPEMEKAAIQCAFGLSCSHIHEQGCRILEELEAGHIHPDRYESWRSMHDELELLTADEY